MNILITGGAGFIGSNLSKKLLIDGHKVICVDNLTISNDNNIKELYKDKNFTFYKEDVTNGERLLNIMRENNIEYVFHLAANSDIQKGGKEPNIDYKNTFLTSYTVLDCMRKCNIKNLFFSSTSAIYGEKINTRLEENTGGLLPISYYGAAKFASESFISAFSHMNDMNVLIFRFPNVIGPNLTHGVLFDFKKKLEQNSHELEILGDGTQSKPYIYVDDLIDAIMLLSFKNVSGVSIYNVGVEDVTTVTEIANIMCEEMDLKNVKYLYTGGKIGWKGDVPTFCYDLSKIHSIGWKPRFSSNEAVRETIKYIIGVKMQ